MTTISIPVRELTIGDIIGKETVERIEWCGSGPKSQKIHVNKKQCYDLAGFVEIKVSVTTVDAILGGLTVAMLLGLGQDWDDK